MGWWSELILVPPQQRVLLHQFQFRVRRFRPAISRTSPNPPANHQSYVCKIVCQVWDLLGGGGGRLLHTLANHQKTVTCLALDGTGSRLLTGGLDRHVKIYNLENFKAKRWGVLVVLFGFWSLSSVCFFFVLCEAAAFLARMHTRHTPKIWYCCWRGLGVLQFWAGNKDAQRIVGTCMLLRTRRCGRAALLPLLPPRTT